MSNENKGPMTSGHRCLVIVVFQLVFMICFIVGAGYKHYQKMGPTIEVKIRYDENATIYYDTWYCPASVPSEDKEKFFELAAKATDAWSPKKK